MHPMSESEIARMAVAMSSGSSTSGFSSSLLGGRVPPHPAVRAHYVLVSDTIDTEVEYRVKKVTEKFSECLHIIANEPSLALFRLQEHVRKSLPMLAQSKVDLTQLKQDVQGTCYDVDYATKTVREMHNSNEPLSSIEALIKRAIASKKRLNAQTSEKWEVSDSGANGSTAIKVRRSPVPFSTAPSTIGAAPSLKMPPSMIQREISPKRNRSPKKSPGAYPEKRDPEKSEAMDIPNLR